MAGASGCKGPRPSGREQGWRAPARTLAGKPAAPAPLSEGAPRLRSVVYTARSAESLRALYEGAAMNSGGHPGRLSSAPTASAAPGNPPRADPGWNVPLKRRWKYIVIHHSASTTGSAAIFHRWHLARGWDGLGYDFVIGNGSASGDGEVEVGYRWRRQQRGAHAGKAEYNEHGIGVCLVGNFQNTYPSAAQMASLTRLVRFLQAKCAIPSSRIIGHHDVPGKDTHCPGRHFDLAAFKHRLRRMGNLPSPSPSLTRRGPARSATLANGSALP